MTIKKNEHSNNLQEDARNGREKKHMARYLSKMQESEMNRSKQEIGEYLKFGIPAQTKRFKWPLSRRSCYL